MLEPRRVINASSWRLTQPVTSIRREPSVFEAVEGGQRAPTRCSKCRALGHSMRSKICPLRFMDFPVQTTPAMDLVPTLDTTPTLAATRATEVAVGNAKKAVATTIPSLSNATVNPPLRAEESALLTTPIALIDSPAASLAQLPVPLASSVSATPTSASGQPSLAMSSVDSPQRYDSPEAIYTRYIAARGAWYAAQPYGSIKTNQTYRKAKGLPQRYSKKSYEWCLDYKQISKHYRGSSRIREWIKEEIIAYLDWSNAEDACVEDQVTKEIGRGSIANTARGMGKIWESAERDSNEQQALYSAKVLRDRAK